jgi:hypothetical protein
VWSVRRPAIEEFGQEGFPLAEIAAAHRASEDGHVRGKLVLLVG